MDCPAGTVMSRLFRGRKILQGLLYDYAVEQGIISAGGRGRRRPRFRRPARPSTSPLIGAGAAKVEGMRRELRRAGDLASGLRRRRAGRRRPRAGRATPGRVRGLCAPGPPAGALQGRRAGPPAAPDPAGRASKGACGRRWRPQPIAPRRWPWLSLPAARAGAGGSRAADRRSPARCGRRGPGSSSRLSAATTPRCRWTSPGRTAARSRRGSAAGSTFRSMLPSWAAVRPAPAAAW